MGNYDERRAARIERLRRAAERARATGQSRVDQGHKMFDVIPMGQPILVGHHSEQRDRNYRERAGNNLTKGFEALEQAEDYDRRADAAESNTAISSDDPQAAAKLTDRIAELEHQQDLWKQVNKAHTQFLKNPASLDAADLSDELKNTIRNYKPAYSWEPHPIPPYRFSNLSANIRRLKERLKTVQAHANDQTAEITVGDIRIVDNVEDNRLQMFFPGKPADDVRARLKSSGFRWTPTLGCWQAYRTGNAKYYAKDIAQKLAG